MDAGRTADARNNGHQRMINRIGGISRTGSGAYFQRSTFSRRLRAVRITMAALTYVLTGVSRSMKLSALCLASATTIFRLSHCHLPFRSRVLTRHLIERESRFPPAAYRTLRFLVGLLVQFTLRGIGLPPVPAVPPVARLRVAAVLV